MVLPWKDREMLPEWEGGVSSRALQGARDSTDLGIGVAGANVFSSRLFSQDEPATTIVWTSLLAAEGGRGAFPSMATARRGLGGPWGPRSPGQEPPPPPSHTDRGSRPLSQHVQLLRRRLPQLGPGSQPVPGLRRPRRRGLDEEAGLPLPAGEGDVQHVQEQRRW